MVGVEADKIYNAVIEVKTLAVVRDIMSMTT